MSLSSRSKSASGPSASSACSPLAASVTSQPSAVEEAAHHLAHLGIVLDQQHLQAGRQRLAGSAGIARLGARVSQGRGRYSVSVVPASGALSSHSAPFDCLTKP